jgi:hypothetical protein
MADSNEDKAYRTDFNGRTYVDAKALLNDPSVKETIERLAKANEKFRNRPGITFLRPLKNNT